MRRRRLLMLTLMALALPTAALGNSFIPDAVSTGNVIPGTFGLQNPFGNMFNIMVQGTDATVNVHGITLTGSCTINVTCNFTGGTVTMTQGSSTFMATITTGSYTVTMMNGVLIDHLAADLKADSQITGGRVDMIDLRGTSMGGMVHWSTGSAVVDAEPVPEAGTLEGLLLGTGLLGLVEMGRRRLQLGT
jgi:hypothetical protein